MTLELARTNLQQQFWNCLRPVNRPAATDTYKRTMAGSSDVFANNFSCYSAAARKALAEDGVNGRHIMAGLEALLYPWFSSPVSAEEVRLAREHFTQKGVVKKFPETSWQRILDNGGFFPLDIYALRGGQTFLAKDGMHVPFLSVEGSGALASHLEPHVENMFASIIYATKARLFYDAAGSKFAEFGLRSSHTVNTHILLMLAIFVGGAFKMTSDDQSTLIFQEHFQDIGTMGHEFIMAYQRKGVTLEQAQEEAFRQFIDANDRSALLPDTIDTVRSGLPMILKLVKEYAGSEKVIMPRFDSGDVAAQCLVWKRMTLEAGIQNIQMVVEDGFTPGKAREVKRAYAEAGFNPDDIIVGAGGYFQDGCTRDAISLAYKRSATLWHGKLETSIKFSDSPGKESIPGQIRVYAQGRTLVVAQANESIDGEALMAKVLDQGKIVYAENLVDQNQRAVRTWSAYDSIEYSPKTQQMIDQRRTERASLL